MIVRACAVDDVPRGEGRTLTVGGRPVAVFHTDTGWYALDAVCPHRGGPLADGLVAERSVICPLHERRFALDSGRELTGTLCVAAHEVEVRGGQVLVALEQDARAA